MASTKKQRGARKTPRSSFRAKKKPVAKKTKPVAKKTVAKKKSKGTRSTPPAARKKKGTRSTPPAARNHEASARKRTNPPASGTAIELGEITVPSGKLAIFDIGLAGYLPRDALDPAIVKADVPADRPLRVIGVRVGKGRFTDCWDHVSVVLGDGELHATKKLGEAGVDFARLILIDHAALDHWHHEDSLDGKADFVFWGRDEAALARAMGAPKIKEGYGWSDLTVEEAEAKDDQAARLKSANGWAFATDVRPHTHHFHALAAARANKHGAGTLELAGTQLLLFFTSWGDGVFPIYLDRDADDHPIAVRIQLATEASNAAMRAVNP